MNNELVFDIYATCQRDRSWYELMLPSMDHEVRKQLLLMAINDNNIYLISKFAGICDTQDVVDIYSSSHTRPNSIMQILEREVNDAFA